MIWETAFALIAGKVDFSKVPLCFLILAVESAVFELLLEVFTNGNIAISNRIKFTTSYPVVGVD